MLLDALTSFSIDQAVTATAISDVIDIKQGTDNDTRDIGAGDPLYLLISTGDVVTDSGSDATLTVTLETSVNADLTSSDVVFSTDTLAFAAFSVAGTRLIAVKLPSFQYKEFVGVRYTIASGPLTAGTFNAALANSIDNAPAYAIRSIITG